MQAESDTPETRDLCLMAVALHGSIPDVVRGEQRATANGRPIFRQVLTWMGSWNKETEAAAYGDGDGPIVLDLYKTLIDMCRPRSERDLIVGFGNLGYGNVPPAAPSYVAFGLTEGGREQADKLFKQHPAYRSFKRRDAE